MTTTTEIRTAPKSFDVTTHMGLHNAWDLYYEMERECPLCDDDHDGYSSSMFDLFDKLGKALLRMQTEDGPEYCLFKLHQARQPYHQEELRREQEESDYWFNYGWDAAKEGRAI